jgi:hypothetical protein
MNNKAWWLRMTLVAALPLLIAGNISAQTDSGGVPQTISLCEVLAHPADHTRRMLRMTVRITATKEGSFLWTPGCRNLGVVSLQMETPLVSESGLKGLQDMLRAHGLSDHPVVATLTGTFIYSQQPDEHRRKAAFKANAASDLKQAERVERP